MKTKAWNLALGVIVISLVLTPFLLVQLLGSQPGTTWRVIGLDVVCVLVAAAGAKLIGEISKSKSSLARHLGRPGIGRVLFSALAFTFVFDTMQTLIRATPYDTLGQMPHQFGKVFFGEFMGAAMGIASLELWQSWRKGRKSQHSTPA
jgi:hypothetical protein